VWLSDGRWHRVYVWLWERERGALPSGWTLHHFKSGDILWCALDHLEPKTRGDNAAARFEEEATA
jgi:hypothetical protein